MIGLENNVFPSYQSLLGNNIEEERRLFYVAMTRARKKLYFTYSKSRNLYGQTQYQQRSLFIDEIPKKYYSEQKVY
jgi:DNA helicase-2/ATP-dependent DNA helicase PcrA